MCNDSSPESPALRHSLGVAEATALVVGGIVGTSIFVIPSDVAAGAGSPLLALVVWLVAGLLALAAALCVAELSASIPATGGPYAFLKRAYGSELVSFSFAWMMSFVYGPGAMAVVASISASFVSPFVAQALHLAHPPTIEIAFGVLAGTCAVNIFGVRTSGIVQSILTLYKVVLLAALAVIAFWLLHPDLSRLVRPADHPLSIRSVPDLTSALLLCIFAFDGAQFVTFVGGEIKRPGKVIPLAIMAGMAVVALLYAAFNLAIFSTLPFATITASKQISFKLMITALGSTGAAMVATTVFISGVAVLNAQCLGYSRILFSLARDRLFFRRAATVSEHSGAPTTAIVVCTACAVLFLMSGTYVRILHYVSFVSQAFTTLIVVAVFLLRRREPHLTRPYRVWGYPGTPAVFIAASTAYMVSLAVTATATASVGVSIVAAGIPCFLLARARRGRASRVTATLTAAYLWRLIMKLRSCLKRGAAREKSRGG